MLGIDDDQVVWSEEAWEEIDMASQAKMAGNSIHLHVIGALLCWVLATGRAVEVDQSPARKKLRRE